MTARTTVRALAAVAGAGALATLAGGLAHADEGHHGSRHGHGDAHYDGSVWHYDGEAHPSDSADLNESAGESADGNTPVYLLKDVPAAAAPEDLLKPVDLTAPAFGVLDGLS
ncbi:MULTISPECIES: hypothetical protein [Pseudonocardia]|uniref:hypothetical protein n=1 Tax=Pseudonocardia TaxID=1847 RepID=UPI001AD67EDB|nr:MULTISPECIES: hypothetical protein [Pseudonocardia]MBO4239004.1 hypothetical protein [Pseudonocardia alni]